MGQEKGEIIRRQIFLPIVSENAYFCFPEAAGWYWGDGDHRVCRRKGELQQFNFHIVVSGKGYVDQKTYVDTLRQGDAFLYFPGAEQNYFSDEEEPWEVLWVHFNGIFLQEFLLEQGFHSGHTFTLKIWEQVKQEMVSLLEEAEKNGIIYPAELSSRMYRIICQLLTQREPLNRNRGAQIYERIGAVLPRMREEAKLPFELKKWADELDISTYYFCKLFKKTVGITPGRFVTLCRLQKAKQLLVEHPDWTIKRIAIESGYPSISYFGKLFLENEGVTPLNYREFFWKGSTGI